MTTRFGVVVQVAILAVPITVCFAGAFAVQVVDYDPGSNPSSGYTNPAVALGEPERMTGEGFGFPGVVSIFSPPFGTDEIVSIGGGGHLTLRFDAPAVDDPGNLFGVDLIVFGNAGFIDANFPNGEIGDPAGLFGADGGEVQVSTDGVNFLTIDAATADGLFPTQGWLDAGPFDPTPGVEPTDFFRPVDPSLTLDDFSGLTYAEALALYDGSGGGAPIDIGATGLTSVEYLRIVVPAGGTNVEIDAAAAIPEPACLWLMCLAALALRRGRRR